MHPYRDRIEAPPAINTRCPNAGKFIRVKKAFSSGSKWQHEGSRMLVLHPFMHPDWRGREDQTTVISFFALLEDGKICWINAYPWEIEEC